MPDATMNGDARDENLSWLALLYASGELDEAQAAVFEKRLGNDQQAREALTVAVQLAQMPVAGEIALPNPSYRERVRRQLGSRPSLWGRFCGRRSYRGHPLLWGLAGAAAAVLLTVAMGQSAPWLRNERAPELTATPPAAEETDAGSSRVASSLEAASIWAEISQSDHLLKAHDEETRRRIRVDELHRFLRSDARRTRAPMNPCN
jgi:anti-sigma-K factor RskA